MFPLCVIISILVLRDIEINSGPAGFQVTRNMIVNLNVRSLSCYLDELMCFNGPDNLGLSKTWLDPNITDDEIGLPDYHLYRCN